MSTSRGFRFTRRSASRALDLREESCSPQLDELLRAASAPATSADLVGEARAVAAFQQAQLASPISSGKQNGKKRAAARLVTAQALTVGLIAVSGTGALALAASNGNLPVIGPVLGKDHEPTKPSVAITTSPPTASTASSTDSATDGSGVTPGDGHTRKPGADAALKQPKGTPAPSLTGLCKAFQAGQSHGHPKDLTKPAFKALVAAAGDEAAVSAYCVTLVGEPKPAKPDKEKPGKGKPARDKPTKAAKPEKPGKSDKPGRDKPKKDKLPKKPGPSKKPGKG